MSNASDNTPRPSIESPTKRLITIALHVIEEALAGRRCGYCWEAGGAHSARCLVGESIAHDPTVRRRAMATGQETDRG